MTTADERDTGPPLIREPIRRPITAIAPPPRGARITYRPASALRPPLGPGLPWAVPGALPPPALRLHPPPRPAEAPLVAVGPGASLEAGPDEPSWPHWRDLLDGPVPEAERLRSTCDEASDTQVATVARAQGHGGSLSRAIRNALHERVGPEPEWPSQDRPRPSADVLEAVEVVEAPPVG